ncbi:hypothetical protein Tco_1238893 [Tanacetum coccineum]
MPPIHDAEEPATMPHDSSQPRVQSLGSDKGSLTLNELMVLCITLSKKVDDLQNNLKQTKLTYGAAYSKLILRVKKLEHKVKTSKSKRRTKVIISDNEEDLEDSYKQGRIIAEIDQNPFHWYKMKELHGFKRMLRLKGGLALILRYFSTAILERQVYIRRSAEKRKDKRKAIMKDDESVQKKTKKQIDQERLGLEEAIRLQEQINEEERQRIARDAEIAKQLQEDIDIARQEQEKYDLAQVLELQKELGKRKEGMTETTQAYDIDWSDPAVLRYHAQQNRYFSKAEVRKNMYMYLKNQGGYKQSHFKGMSYEDIRPIFERVWDQNQSFVPKDFEIEKEEKKKKYQKKAKELISDSSSKRVYIEARQLWDLVKKKFSLTEPTVDKEKVLWVKLKRLFEPDDDATLWKLQRYMHDPLTWKLYDTCGVHHVSIERGHDIFMLVEKDYPPTRALITVMLANTLVQKLVTYSHVREFVAISIKKE